MKKKILASLLVCVMLALTMVSCFSYEKTDLTQYATFNKADIEGVLTSLVIEDSEFGTDEETRAAQVENTIWETLAAKADKDNRVTEGTIGEHDTVYYNYYITAKYEEVTALLNTANMQSSKETSFQLGGKDLTDLQKKIAAAIATIDLSTYAYTTESATSVKAADGDDAFISYTKEYTKKIDDKDNPGSTIDSPVKEIVSLDRVTLNGDDDFLKNFIGLDLATAKDEFTVTDETLGEVKYTDAKVMFVVKTGKEVTVTDTTYTDAKKITDSKGVERDVKDVELTYHIYPVCKVETLELTADNIIRYVYGSNIYRDSLECFKDEESKTADGKTVAELIDAIGSMIKDETDAKKALTTAEEAAEKCEEDKAAKQKIVDDAGEAKTEAMEEDLTNANKALEEANKALEEAKTAADNASKTVNDQLALIYSCKNDMQNVIVDAYKKSVYDDLESNYNTDIKNNLATAIWDLILTKVTVSSLPREMVKKTCDSLLDNHENTFYTGNASTGSSNYSTYGTFENYLMDLTETSSFSAAKDAVWSDAEKIVEPILKMYVVARAFDQLVTDAEFKSYKKDNALYDYYADYAGEDSVRYAYQFDKLMNYFLESEEEDGKVTYKKVQYSFKEEN